MKEEIEGQLVYLTEDGIYEKFDPPIPVKFKPIIPENCKICIIETEENK